MNDHIDLTPINLSALDPTRDSARFNDVVSSITRDAMQGGRLEAASSLESDGIFDRLTGWWPATLAAAALIIAVSIPELLASTRVRPPASAMEVLGIPAALSDVLRSRQAPSLADLTDALAAIGGQ